MDQLLPVLKGVLKIFYSILNVYVCGRYNFELCYTVFSIVKDIYNYGPNDIVVLF